MHIWAITQHWPLRTAVRHLTVDEVDAYLSTAVADVVPVEMWSQHRPLRTAVRHLTVDKVDAYLSTAVADVVPVEMWSQHRPLRTAVRHLTVDKVDPYLSTAVADVVAVEMWSVTMLHCHSLDDSTTLSTSWTVLIVMTHIAYYNTTLNSQSLAVTLVH